jgi:hypothetical protein
MQKRLRRFIRKARKKVKKLIKKKMYRYTVVIKNIPIHDQYYNFRYTLFTDEKQEEDWLIRRAFKLLKEELEKQYNWNITDEWYRAFTIVNVEEPVEVKYDADLVDYEETAWD